MPSGRKWWSLAVYPNLMLAHKGKAGWWFTALGYGAALSLIILYVTGILLMWKNRGSGN